MVQAQRWWVLREAIVSMRSKSPKLLRLRGRWTTWTLHSRVWRDFLSSCRSRTDTEGTSIIIKSLKALPMNRYHAGSSMLTSEKCLILISSSTTHSSTSRIRSLRLYNSRWARIRQLLPASRWKSYKLWKNLLTHAAKTGKVIRLLKRNKTKLLKLIGSRARRILLPILRRSRWNIQYPKLKL